MNNLDNRLKMAYLTARHRRRQGLDVHSIHIELGSAALERLRDLSVVPDAGTFPPFGTIDALGGFPILEAPEQLPEHIAIRMTELIF